MLQRHTVLALVSLPLVAAAQQTPPEKALKYHEALLKRPHNTTLFDRFYGAWIDELPANTLGTFLTARAESNGGQEWTVLALYQMRAGQEDLALQSLAKAIAAAPDDMALPLDRAKILMRRLEFAAARADLARVSSGKDEALALEAAKLLGKCWLREGKADEAVKTWDTLLALHPQDEDLLEDLVETAASEGDAAQAIRYIDKLAQVSADPYKKTLRGLRKGDLLAAAGRNDDAVAAYTATLEAVGEGSWLEREVLAQIDKIFRKQDQLAQLAECLKKLTESNPRRLLIHRQLAKLEAAQGNVDGAIGRFREVLQRSPGDRELREEFIRLLTDSERFDDASAELGKLIELAPQDAGLQLQLATLKHRQGNAEATLAALRKAHELLGKDESSGLRIAGLMLQYDKPAEGEALLKSLAASPTATPNAAETLATHYGRTNRKPEAIALLKQLAGTEDLDALLRASNSLATLGDNAAALEVLNARMEKFGSDPRFLTAYCQAQLASGKGEQAVAPALKLVRLAKQADELADRISLAMRAITAANQGNPVREQLQKQAERSSAESCLLAAIMAAANQHDDASKLLDPLKDPLAVHFHVALLDRRNQFDRAIAVLLRLTDTDEGRKVAYFKELSALQRRSGKLADALATLERWKQSAPGDKAAWLNGISILKESGKTAEAITLARQAAAHFEKDADLAASLATMYGEAGQTNDAQAIYWRLYDEAPSAADQTRWAMQLTQVAQRSGLSASLKEKFLERARANRSAISPILGLAEIARLENNEEKYRSLLQDAVRIQPKELDLRLRIANLEAESGNPEREIAVLTEAVSIDPSGRARHALAQAYLRQGKIIQGMRELQAAAGKATMDLRAVESTAASLAGQKQIEQAIQFLRSEAPSGGDWRSRYLLACMLEQDGGEAEAFDIFRALLQAEGEIENLPKVAAGNNRTIYPTYPGQAAPSPALLKLRQESLAFLAAYAEQMKRSYGNTPPAGVSAVGPYFLPDSPEAVRAMAFAHLMRLIDGMRSEKATAAKAQLAAAGVSWEDGELLKALTGNVQDSYSDQRANPLDFFNKHAGHPLMLEWLLSQSIQRFTGDTTQLRKALASNTSISDNLRLNGWVALVKGAKADDPAWQQTFDLAFRMLDHADPDEMQACYTAIYQLHRSTQYDEDGEAMPETSCPEEHRGTLKKLARAWLDRRSREPMTAGPGKAAPWFNSLYLINEFGTPDEWIQEINRMIRTQRAASAGTPMRGIRYARKAQYLTMNGSRELSAEVEAALFAVPALGTTEFLSADAFLLTLFDSNRGGMKTLLTLEQLADQSAKIESPFLRAWLLMKTGKTEAARQALTAAPGKEEAQDIENLRAILAIQDHKPGEAIAALERARLAATADTAYAKEIHLSEIGIALTMPAEERAKIADTLREALTNLRQKASPPATALLAAKAKLLGLDDLAQSLAQAPAAGNPQSPTGGGAAFVPPQPPRLSRPSAPPSNSARTSLDKIKKFVTEDKPEAAAREAILAYHSMSSSSGNGEGFKQSVLPLLNDKARVELLRLCDPGASKSLSKRLMFTDIAALLGKKDLELKTLEALASDRPDDPLIATKLAFALPPDQPQRRLELIPRAVLSDEFIKAAARTTSRLQEQKDPDAVIQYYEGFLPWLESCDPASVETVNLSWINHGSIRFFQALPYCKLPSLLKPNSRYSGNDPSQQADAPLLQRRAAVAKRLALAMLRIPQCQEAGFRLLNGMKDDRLSDGELDIAARAALATQLQQLQGGNLKPCFTLWQNGTGYDSSSETLESYSSLSWLMARLNDGATPDSLLPPAYGEELNQRSPKYGPLVARMARAENAGQLLAALDDYPVTASDRSGMRRQFERVQSNRLRRLPGAAQALVERITKIQFAENSRDATRQLYALQVLFNQASEIAPQCSDQELDAIFLAIAKLFTKELAELAEGKVSNAVASRMQVFTSMRQQQTDLSPESWLRITRALYRAGLPINDSGLNRFCYRPPNKAEEAEALMESLGLFCEPAQWSTIAAWNLNLDSQDGKNYTSTLQSIFLLPQCCSQLARNLNQEAFIKRLAARTKGRFGALIACAAMSSGPARSEYAKSAFNEFSADLAKLSTKQLDAMTPWFEWLPTNLAQQAPAKLKVRLQKIAEKRFADVVKKADAYLDQLKKADSSEGFQSGRATEVIGSAAVYSVEKAAQVFLACEAHYLTQLSKGNKRSSGSSDSFDIAPRDYALLNLFSYSPSPLSDDPALACAFLQCLLKHPEASRLSLGPLGDSNSSSSVLTYIGRKINQELQKFAPAKDPAPYYKDITEWQQPHPEELQKLLLTCSSIQIIQNNSGLSLSYVENHRKALEQGRATWPIGYPFHLLTIGIPNWTSDTTAGRELTCKALLEILRDSSIAEPVRQALAFNCAIRVPHLWNRPDVAPQLAAMFEAYCSTERSAVNGWSLQLANSLTKAGLTPEAIPQAQRFLNAFWNNANVSKPGGHPPIPDILSKQLFNVALRAKDEATIQRVKPQVMASMTGRMPEIAQFVKAGYPDLAKSALPAPDQAYQANVDNFTFDRELEEKLPSFLATIEDPATRLRFETQLLNAKPASNGMAPKATPQDMTKRLATAYIANPPQQPDLQGEILSAITTVNPMVTFDLADALLAWANTDSFQKRFDAWFKDNQVKNHEASQALYLRARRECELHTKAAMLGLYRGDATLLEHMTEVLTQAPPLGEQTNYHGNTSYVVQAVQRELLTQSLAWLMIDVAHDHTAGFEKALTCFEKLAVNIDKRQEFSTEDEIIHLTCCQFLAQWLNQPQRFEQLRQKFEKRSQQVKAFPGNHAFPSANGLHSFLSCAYRYGLWYKPALLPLKTPFLQRAFRHEPLASTCPAEPFWLNHLATHGLQQAMFDVSAKFAEAHPKQRSQLAWYHGKQLAAKNQPAEAIEVLRKGIDAALPGADGNITRGACKYEIAQVQQRQNLTAEAKQTLEAIPPEESNELLKTTYKKLIESVIGAAQPPPPAPAPPPPSNGR